MGWREDFINRGLEDAYANQGGGNTWVGDNGYIYDGTNNYGGNGSENTESWFGGNGGNNVSDNGNNDYLDVTPSQKEEEKSYGYDYFNDSLDKRIRESGDGRIDGGDQWEDDGSLDPGSFEEDPDKVLRDDYNAWYLWKNGLDEIPIDENGMDPFHKTFGNFLGYNPNGEYVGTAQDWYDLLNHSWETDAERRKNTYEEADTDTGYGLTDWSVRNDYTEAYDKLYTVADEYGNHYIPMEAIQDWYDSNKAANIVDDDMLMNLAFGGSDGGKFLGTNNDALGQSPLDAISNIVSAVALSGGVNPFQAGTILGDAWDEYQQTGDRAKFNNYFKTYSNTDNKLKNTGINLNGQNGASYLNNLASNLYGVDNGYELSNDSSSAAAKDNTSPAYDLLSRANLPGYHIKARNNTPASNPVSDIMNALSNVGARYGGANMG